MPRADGGHNFLLLLANGWPGAFTEYLKLIPFAIGSALSTMPTGVNQEIRIGSAAFGPDLFPHNQPILSPHFLHHMVLLSMQLIGGFYAHNGYAGRRLTSKSSQADWGP
jgi:hypothetical protein